MGGSMVPSDLTFDQESQVLRSAHFETVYALHG